MIIARDPQLTPSVPTNGLDAKLVEGNLPTMISPDMNALGFLDSDPSALRYENQSTDPEDVAMKLASLVSPGGRVLDVGCGTGSVTEIIKARVGADVVGIEPDPERQAMAVTRGLQVYCGVLTEEFLVTHGPFQTIIFADVLEHLPNPGKILLIAKKGLLPGGAIVASVPNVAHIVVRMKLLCGRFDYRSCGIMDATHLRWFTRKTLHGFLSNLGFYVTDHLYTVNSSMPEYGSPLFRFVRHKNIMKWMVRVFPDLWGCQHVVRATSVERGPRR
jgi:2-polyprenyl-3-methyl-5-hydroxy-6-metoxy-1,4-benzoquinol methylase